MKVRMKVQVKVAYVEDAGKAWYSAVFRAKNNGDKEYMNYIFMDRSTSVIANDINELKDKVFEKCLEIYTNIDKVKIKVK